MTADEKLARIRVKVEWAKEHFSKLEVLNRQFLNTEPKPYAYAVKDNAETGYTEFYLLKDAEIPPKEIGLLAGDVAHNLRSALDHLAFQLWLVSPFHTGDGKHVYFPVFSDAAKCKAMNTGKVQGMTQDAKDAIARTEPYVGGKGHALWLLNEMDIADKHRTLVTADIRSTEIQMGFVESFLRPRVPHVNVVRFGGFSFPGFRAPAKAGDIIATVATKTYKDVKLTFDIAFSEPGVVEGKSVLITLKYLIDTVENLLPAFEPLLS